MWFVSLEKDVASEGRKIEMKMKIKTLSHKAALRLQGIFTNSKDYPTQLDNEVIEWLEKLVVITKAKDDKRSDKERLDWLERETRHSQTSVSFKWVYMDNENNEPGFRFMRYYRIDDTQPSIRRSIDVAMEKSK
jgi:hypothetical protein